MLRFASANIIQLHSLTLLNGFISLAGHFTIEGKKYCDDCATAVAAPPGEDMHAVPVYRYAALPCLPLFIPFLPGQVLYLPTPIM